MQHSTDYWVERLETNFPSVRFTFQSTSEAEDAERLHHFYEALSSEYEQFNDTIYTHQPAAVRYYRKADEYPLPLMYVGVGARQTRGWYHMPTMVLLQLEYYLPEFNYNECSAKIYAYRQSERRAAENYIQQQEAKGYRQIDSGRIERSSPLGQYIDKLVAEQSPLITVYNYSQTLP